MRRSQLARSRNPSTDSITNGPDIAGIENDLTQRRKANEIGKSIVPLRLCAFALKFLAHARLYVEWNWLLPDGRGSVKLSIFGSDMASPGDDELRYSHILPTNETHRRQGRKIQVCRRLSRKVAILSASQLRGYNVPTIKTHTRCTLFIPFTENFFKERVV